MWSRLLTRGRLSIGLAPDQGNASGELARAYAGHKQVRMKSHVRYGIKSLCLGLTFAIVFQFAVPPAQAQNPPTELNIVVVEGEGAINNVRQRATREPILQIED